MIACTHTQNFYPNCRTTTTTTTLCVLVFQLGNFCAVPLELAYHTLLHLSIVPLSVTQRDNYFPETFLRQVAKNIFLVSIFQVRTLND